MKWEYKTIVEMHSGKLSLLNELGAEGWELVAVTPETTETYGVAYLKRPLNEPKLSGHLRHVEKPVVAYEPMLEPDDYEKSLIEYLQKVSHSLPEKDQAELRQIMLEKSKPGIPNF